jgi:hypothetical protein
MIYDHEDENPPRRRWLRVLDGNGRLLISLSLFLISLAFFLFAANAIHTTQVLQNDIHHHIEQVTAQCGS